MARVKVCPDGHENPPDRLRCGYENCGYPLEGVRVTDAAPEGAGDGLSGRGGTQPSGPMTDDARRATLVFDRGEVVVTGREPAGIGRDPAFSPGAAGRIGDNDYVSRRHAEVFIKYDGCTYVRHLSATNPTYVNGERYTRMGDEVRLREDDVIGFSRHLAATVRFG